MCSWADGTAAKRRRFLPSRTLGPLGSVGRFRQYLCAAEVLLHLTARIGDTVSNLARQSAAPLIVNAWVGLDEVELRGYRLLNKSRNAPERFEYLERAWCPWGFATSLDERRNYGFERSMDCIAYDRRHVRNGWVATVAPEFGIRCPRQHVLPRARLNLLER
jgi:hypothetical protein